jgi:hypothetical protein
MLNNVNVQQLFVLFLSIPGQSFFYAAILCFISKRLIKVNPPYWKAYKIGLICLSCINFWGLLVAGMIAAGGPPRVLFLLSGVVCIALTGGIHGSMVMTDTETKNPIGIRKGILISVVWAVAVIILEPIPKPRFLG